MKRVSIVVAALALTFGMQAQAQNPVEFWGCKFAEGYEMSDLMAHTKEFSKIVDSLPDRKYSAWVMTPFFSNNMSAVDFWWVGAWDSNTNMGAGFDEFFASEKGAAWFAKYQEMSNCEVHTLMTSTSVHMASE